MINPHWLELSISQTVTHNLCFEQEYEKISEFLSEYLRFSFFLFFFFFFFFFFFLIVKFSVCSRTSMARTPLGLWKFVRDMDVLSRNMKKYQNFNREKIQCLVAKFSIYLNRRIFIMKCQNNRTVHSIMFKPLVE